MIPLHLQNDMVSGVPTENLLTAILEALAEPAVSYIGLGYDSTVPLATGRTTLSTHVQYRCNRRISFIFMYIHSFRN